MMAEHRNSYQAVVGICILAAACAILASALSGVDAHRTAQPLPDYGQLPDFSLRDHHERTISRAGLMGSVWIADFIFTRCAGQCPLMSARMAKLQDALEGTPAVRLVSFSVDPVHDTTEVLAAYAQRYGARAGQWQFVTGDYASIVALAEKGFRLGVDQDGSAQEPITHSVRLVLVDPQGHIRGYYDATEAQAMADLQEDTRRLLRTDGS
jgi:cytochrome oxidase Cu insertion factor (SCO1/SenC/PrrC family)